MNLQELKASHPELVTELAAELAAGSEAAQKDAVSKAQKETLELVAALGGADLVEKAQTLLAAGFHGPIVVELWYQEDPAGTRILEDHLRFLGEREARARSLLPVE